MMFSIITTVYNNNPYLFKYLECVNNLNFKNAELIILNDGSTDNVMEIIKENLTFKNVVYVENQKNIGIFLSQKKALESSKGDYILFLDSDDIFINDVLKDFEILLKNKDIDVLLYNNRIIKSNFLIEECPLDLSRINYNLSLDKVIEEFLLRTENGSLSNKVFKSNIIKNHTLFDIEFPVRYAPDNLISFLVFMGANNVAHIDKCYYFAHSRIGSTNRTLSCSRFEEYKFIYNYYDAYLSKYASNNLKRYNASRYISELLYDYVIVLTAKMTFNDFKVYNRIAREEISSNLEKMDDEYILSAPKRVILFSLMKLTPLGTYIFSYVISKVYKMKYTFKRIFGIEE